MSKAAGVYDRKNIVERPHVIRAGSLKIAAYRVRDPDTEEMSSLQFHMTYDNMVMAVMEEKSAELFARFVNDTLGVRNDAA